MVAAFVVCGRRVMRSRRGRERDSVPMLAGKRLLDRVRICICEFSLLMELELFRVGSFFCIAPLVTVIVYRAVRIKNVYFYVSYIFK